MVKNIFSAETIKIRRSFVLWLHIVALIVFPIIIGLYYGSRYSLLGVKQAAIINFYEFLAILTPLAISIIAGIVFDREQKAGKFHNVLSLPESKNKVIQLQVIYYWTLYIVTILGITIIYYAILKYIFGVGVVSLLPLLLTSICFGLLAYVQYELSFWIASLLGTGLTLLLGLVGSLIAILGVTVLLDKIWFLVPWAWQIRLSAYWQPGVLVNTNMFTSYSLEYIFSIFITAIIFILSSLYYTKYWHGNRN